MIDLEAARRAVTDVRQAIVDQDGRSVLLRGFNVDALTDPRDAELGPPTPLTDEDARLMRQAGFDCVRLPIVWSLLEPTPEHFDRAYLARIVGAVRLLERYRLRVVLDTHFGIGWGPRSEIPSWASMTWVPDWRPVHSPPWNESVSPRVAVDEGYFWLADAWQHALAQAWEMVASQFRDDPGVVGYDIYNEPHPLPVPPGLFETRYLFPFYARTISTISHADPNHLFIVESTLFDDLPTTVEPLRAPGSSTPPTSTSAHYQSAIRADLPGSRGRQGRGACSRGQDRRRCPVVRRGGSGPERPVGGGLRPGVRPGHGPRWLRLGVVAVAAKRRLGHSRRGRDSTRSDSAAPPVVSLPGSGAPGRRCQRRPRRRPARCPRLGQRPCSQRDRELASAPRRPAGGRRHVPRRIDLEWTRRSDCTCGRARSVR